MKGQATLFFILVFGFIIMVLFVFVGMILSAGETKAVNELEVKMELLSEGEKLTKFLASKKAEEPTMMEILGTYKVKGFDKALGTTLEEQFRYIDGTYLSVDDFMILSEGEEEGAVSAAQIPVPGAGESGKTRVEVKFECEKG